MTRNAASVSKLQLLRYLGGGVAFTLPFLSYIYTVLRYAVDVPVYDDYGVFLRFLPSFLQAKDLSTGLRLVFAPQLEHRLAVLRLLALAEYYLFGTLDFRVLLILAAAGWLAAVLILSLILRKRLGLSPLQVLPLPYILLLPRLLLDSYSTSALQFNGLVLFAILVFLMLEQGHIILACASYALALYSSAGGLSLLPIGALYLFSERKWKQGALFLTASTLLTLPYARASASSFVIIENLRGLEASLTFFFAFLGNIVPTYDLALPIGLIVGGVLLSASMLHRGETFLRLCSVWILVTAGVTALSRSHRGAEAAVASRYAPLALLAVACCYGWLHSILSGRGLASDLRTRIAGLGLIVFAGLFLASSTQYSLASTFQKTYEQRLSDLFATTTSPLVASQAATSPEAQVLSAAIASGAYDPSGALRARLAPVRWNSVLPASGSFRGSLDAYDGARLSGWALIPGVQSAQSTILVVLSDGKSTYGIATIPVLRPDVSASLGGGIMYDYAGYEAYPSSYAVPQGLYDVGILVSNGPQRALEWTKDSYEAP